MCVTKKNSMKLPVALVTFLFALFFLPIVNSKAQNVGIGTTSPQARFHVVDSSVLFSASGLVSLPAGNPPVSGPGKRMMWYSGKAAFRSGYVQSTEWDNNRIGPYSFAAGFNPVASGSTSFSFGSQTIASANYSTAFGVQTIASGEYTTAMGAYSVAAGPVSSSLGLGTIAKGYSSTVVGMYNDSILASNDSYFSPTTPLFMIGNGSDHTARSNAMTVLKNGNVGLGLTPSNRLHVGAGTVRIDGPATTNSVSLSLGGYGDLQVDAFGVPGGRFTIKENGKVGIGTPSPGFPLNFANSVGDKISLWGNSGEHYGIGIQSYLL